MVEFVGTSVQLGDILTKPLSKNTFQELSGKIDLIDISKQHGKN
jgi:hypothetical protein